MTISLQGKWKNLRSLVQQMTEQGWSVVSCEPDEMFQFTTCILEC